ncbi:hypothetical protein A3I18_00730 [Candidatus Campbellbacteria bacterium RIFCSPLOWO2_02_FULL_35_11]|uniref:SHSP domain-containing protein n=2 Tax=Candidatus Campbelliibacteriota TaxID=1752727 RepID=A0A1F5ENU5_9BACT|nr:MAG: hypothetical protein A3E89_01280 [Candidatus Campbellbacteria bacterium RIFCSPHIGHO2_12_FULL_35_10]OGD69908.1 MAG: hypothetical protein A3I18_00730 [Candidatus Campbellbacteria bacterium RIFCSPLOWO2_02_FULL_35_11]
MKSFFEKLTGSVDIDDLNEPINKEMGKDKKLKITRDENEDFNSEKNWMEEENEEGELTIDMYQDSDNVVIKTMIAGVKPEDLDIDIARDMVTVRGKREESRVIEEEDYFAKELYWGSFSRTITLPSEINIDEAEAEEKHGLLTIKLPKTDKGRKTKLKVKSK